MTSITLKELANELNMDRSHLRRFVLALGIEPFKVRTMDSGNQLTLAVTEDEAKRIKRTREEAGFSSTGIEKKIDNSGEFYVVMLDPVRPKRLKLGFSISAGDRLVSYRTSNPAAQLLGKWPCHRSWEKCVMAALTNRPREVYLVNGEVFDCNDVEQFMVRANEFFSLLPVPEYKPELSSDSPLL